MPGNANSDSATWQLTVADTVDGCPNGALSPAVSTFTVTAAQCRPWAASSAVAAPVDADWARFGSRWIEAIREAARAA